MKRIAITIILIVVIYPLQTAGAPLKSEAPRLANIFLHWSLTDEKAKDLAKWDLVILDMDIQANNPGVFSLMRRVNPDIKILAYVPMAEVMRDVSTLPSYSLRYQLTKGIDWTWYLTDSSGNRLSFWQGNWIVNISNECPRAGGQRWNEYLPDFVKEKIVSSGKWDGVFYDNGWEDISYFAGPSIDLNHDGNAAGAADANRLWKEGVAQTLERTADLLGGNYLVMLNDGPYYASYTRGVAIENFSGRDWTQTMNKYQNITNQSQSPSANILNSNTKNTGNLNDYREVRFGYTSAMLFDGYYSFDFGDQDHGQTWWYDEYNAYLGPAKGSAQNVLAPGSNIQEGLWKREFQNGLVIVNSTWQNQSMDFLGEYEKLHGTQDKSQNDGSIVSGVMLAPRDGIVLIRPIEKISGSTYSNGSFVRIFNQYGDVFRTGFFAYDPRFRGGSNVVTADINNDGREETVVGDVNKVDIFDADGNLYRRFYPYTEAYTGGINIAVGDLDQDNDMEIVTGTERGGGPQIRIFNHDGVLINPGFFAYSTSFRGGVNVAIGDLNGDGWKEIIAGAGYGGGPHIRVFGLDGRVINPGFFAYDPAFRGGVNVATGDLDGDGADEIIAGAGRGGGPHVRVFDQKGNLLFSKGFFAYDSSSRDGVKVTSADLDNDGKNEIIAQTTSVFTVSALHNF